MKTFDKLGRESGNFPSTEEENNSFSDSMKYIHARIMGQV